jgi:hypothetical protein
MNRRAAGRAVAAFTVLFFIGLIIYVTQMLTAGVAMRDIEGDGTVSRGVFGMTVLTVERIGNVTTVAPGVGIFFLLLVIPAVVAVAVYLLVARRGAPTSVSQ